MCKGHEMLWGMGNRNLFLLPYRMQVIIAGGKGKPDTEALMNATFAAYAPDKVTILLDVADAKLMQASRRANQAHLISHCGLFESFRTASTAQGEAVRRQGSPSMRLPLRRQVLAMARQWSAIQLEASAPASCSTAA